MDRSRRRFLGAGAMGAAFAGLISCGRQSTTDTAGTGPGPGERWDNGMPPGQNLPPEAANGPWRNLRAVKEKKVIDYECHPYETPTQGSNYKETGELHAKNEWKDFMPEMVASMDTHGFDRVCLNPQWASFELIRDTSYKNYPDRIIMMTSLKTEEFFANPAIRTPQWAAKVTREQLEWGCKGIGEVGSFNYDSSGPYSLKDIEPYYNVLLEYDLPILTHCGWTATGSSREGFVYKAAWRWAEDVAAVASAYPDLKIMLGHAGGRFDFLDGYEALRLAFSFDNIYIQMSKSTARIVTEAVKGIGAERVVFATDWNRPEMKTYGPYHYRSCYQHWYNLNQIAEADITEDQRDMILYKNALRLVHMT